MLLLILILLLLFGGGGGYYAYGPYGGMGIGGVVLIVSGGARPDRTPLVVEGGLI